MKTVPAISTGPVDDVRRADPHTRVALADAVARSARLWRSVADSAAPVPGLTWTVGQTAAHVVGDMGEYTEALTRHVSGDRAALSIPDGSPARVRTAVNDRHLIDVAERDPRRLADMLEETAASYLAAASAIGTSEGVAILTADGLVLEPAVMTCLLLGEQLVHGLDIARAAHRPWSIGRDDALLVIPAVAFAGAEIPAALADQCQGPQLRAADARRVPLSDGDHRRHRCRHGGRGEGGLCDHRRSGCVPAPRFRPSAAVAAASARQAASRRAQAMVGRQVRHLAGQPVAAPCGGGPVCGHHLVATCTW